MIGEDLRNPGFSVTAPPGNIEPAGGRFAHGGKHPDAQVAVLAFFNLESGPAGKPFEEIGITEETAVQVGAHDFAGVIVGNEDYVAPGDGGSQAGQVRVFQNGRGVVNMADRRMDQGLGPGDQQQPVFPEVQQSVMEAGKGSVVNEVARFGGGVAGIAARIADEQGNEVPAEMDGNGGLHAGVFLGRCMADKTVEGALLGVGDQGGEGFRRICQQGKRMIQIFEIEDHGSIGRNGLQQAEPFDGRSVVCLAQISVFAGIQGGNTEGDGPDQRGESNDTDDQILLVHKVQIYE